MAIPSRTWPGWPFALLAAASLGLVAGGVVMSEFFHLAACPLCIIQRMLYLALALAALVGIPFAGSTPGRRTVGGLTAGVAAVGAWVAGYQSWIQRFAQDTGCSGYQTWWEAFVDWAGEQAPALFLSDGICSDPGWVFLGLSIAEWSLLCFLALFAIGLRSAIARR